MKKRLILLSVILLISLMTVGNTMAWLTSSSDEVTEKMNIGTINVELLQSGLNNIRVISSGTSKTYVRARLIPQWSDNSLSTSNVKLDLNLTDWESNDDGYYYFKYYLDKDQITSNLLNNVEFNNLASEYQGHSFNIKVVSEGVQITNQYWRELWGLDNLPFTPDQPWTP